LQVGNRTSSFLRYCTKKGSYIGQEREKNEDMGPKEGPLGTQGQAERWGKKKQEVLEKKGSIQRGILCCVLGSGLSRPQTEDGSFAVLKKVTFTMVSSRVGLMSFVVAAEGVSEKSEKG